MPELAIDSIDVAGRRAGMARCPSSMSPMLWSASTLGWAVEVELTLRWSKVERFISGLVSGQLIHEADGWQGRAPRPPVLKPQSGWRTQSR